MGFFNLTNKPPPKHLLHRLKEGRQRKIEVYRRKLREQEFDEEEGPRQQARPAVKRVRLYPYLIVDNSK